MNDVAINRTPPAESREDSELGSLRWLKAAIDEHAIVSVADRDGTITEVNDKFCEISGYRREELLGRNHRMLKSGIHPPGFYLDLWRTISSGKTWQGEICNRRKDGGFYWVEATIVPLLDGQGRPLRYLSIRTDVTQIKEVELALAEREQQLRQAQRVAKLGYWRLDSATGQLNWSDTVFEIHGVSRADFVPDVQTYYARLVHPEDVAKLQAKEQEAYQTNRPQSVDYRICCPDGAQKWVHIEGRVVEGEVDRREISGIIQDITARKQDELAVSAARDLAEVASRAKSEFLASMSHELRTPLNAILGYAQLFSIHPQLPGAVKGHVEEIRRAGKHLLALVNDLIDLARIESGRLDLAIEPIVVKRVMQDSLALVEPIAAEHDIALHHDVGPCAPLLLRVDYVRLRQVLINLLSNAIKYNRPRGTVRLGCSAQNGRVRMSVTDIGPGIPEAKQARLFVAFDRLGEERGTVEGSGIGLNVSKRIVEAMGGSIGFASNEGEGSTFWVEFPICGERSDSVDSEAAEFVGAPMDASAPGEAVVLYIEDNPMNLRLMRQIFGLRKGIKLMDAHSAEIGIQLAQAVPPALVLLDINLPGMDGYAALKVLKGDRRTADIPVIAISANAMKGDDARGIAAGFDAYFTKPIDIKALFAALEKVGIGRAV